MSNVVNLNEFRLRKELKNSDPDELFRNAFRLSEADEASTEAEQIYLKILMINPDHASAMANLGNVYFAQGRADEAKAQWHAATEKDHTAAEPHYNLGYLSLSQGDFKTAIPMLKKCLEIDPDFADAYFNLADAYVNTKKKKLANEHFARYIELAPSGYWSNLARERMDQTK